MAAPSATTSFTFAPKQKVKQSARFTGKKSRGDGRNENIKDGVGGGGGIDGGDGAENPEPEEDVVVCSFAQSSKVVDAWMKAATKDWKATDKTADRQACQKSQAFSQLMIDRPEESSEAARRIGSRAGLGAEVASRKRKQEAASKDESRNRIFGAAGKRRGAGQHNQQNDLDAEGVGGGKSAEDSDSEDELSRTAISKTKKVSSSQDSVIEQYRASKKKAKKKKNKA
jgi:hypothetical protein